jgi:hypothetical protein
VHPYSYKGLTSAKKNMLRQVTRLKALFVHQQGARLGGRPNACSVGSTNLHDPVGKAKN